MSDVHLSVVIPAFNEEKRIKQTLADFTQYFGRQPYQTEIIVVDDGSSDRTAEAARNGLKNHRHKVISNETNKGKGFAVKRGVLSAEGSFVLFSDADQSTPIEEVEGFLKELENGYDVVIGSRALKGSRIEVRQNMAREGMGRLFNLVARFFSFQGIQDSQCGFKCFRRRQAQELFSLQRLEGFSFDAEIIYLAQKKGYRILEKAVTWRNSRQSRVNLWMDPIRMFVDVFKIRWMHRRLSL